LNHKEYDEDVGGGRYYKKAPKLIWTDKEIPMVYGFDLLILFALVLGISTILIKRRKTKIS